MAFADLQECWIGPLVNGGKRVRIQWSGTNINNILVSTVPAALVNESLENGQLVITNLEIRYDGTVDTYLFPYVYHGPASADALVDRPAMHKVLTTREHVSWENLNIVVRVRRLASASQFVCLACVGGGAADDVVSMTVRGYLEYPDTQTDVTPAQPVTVDGYTWPLRRRY